jgi:hypothetical protein
MTYKFHKDGTLPQNGEIFIVWEHKGKINELQGINND